MLSYALAIAVGISSLVLFFTAFVLSDLHRQDDFLWSGVGLFYALVLWYCASNITGAVLLGQAAASALIISFSWQNLKLRKAIAHPESAPSTLSSKFSWLRSFGNLVKRKSPSVKSTANTTTNSSTVDPAVNLPKVTEQEIAIPDTTSKSTSATAPSQQPTTETVSSKLEQGVKEPETTSQQSEVKPTTVINAPNTAPEPQPETIVIKVKKAAESDTPASLTEESSDPEASSESSAIPAEPELEPEESTTDSAPVPDIATPEIEETKPTDSRLDSLETVEVAEILEAEPEERGGNRDGDRSNIIDVTTTDVDSVAQVPNTDSPQENNPNSNHESQ